MPELTPAVGTAAYKVTVVRSSFSAVHHGCGGCLSSEDLPGLPGWAVLPERWGGGVVKTTLVLFVIYNCVIKVSFCHDHKEFEEPS